MARRPGSNGGVPGLDRAAGNLHLSSALTARSAEIAAAWAAAAGSEVRSGVPDLDGYLRSLVRGLADVFRDDDWTVTQEIIDALAETRARTGPRAEQAIQRALLAGRLVVSPFYETNAPEGCDELFLEALHECIFRFAESYQGTRLVSETERIHTRIIKSLVMALEARDPYTKGHSISVALLSQRIAERLGDAADPTRAYLAGLLHDIGKVGIPDAILLKEASLSAAEWDVMRAHPAAGAGILKPIHLYPDVVEAVLSHHENFDGTGYPDGLRGGEIPVIARIIRVADSFDAMTSVRAYRTSASVQETCDEMSQLAGTLYDPDVVEALVTIVDAPGAVRELSLASLQIDLGDFEL